MATTTTDRRQGVNSSIAIKAPVKAATTANITLEGEQTIDGVAVVANDRVLVKDQTTGAENGIYDVSTSSWTRAPDCDGSYDLTEGTLIKCLSGGTTNGSHWFELTTSGTITIGTTSLTFTDSTASLLPGIVSTADATAITINSSENVGIGVAPDGNGRLQLDAPTASNTNLTFSQNGTNKWLIGNTNSTDAFRFYDMTAGAERMQIDSAGNVGIGTSTINNRLVIGGAGAQRLQLSNDTIGYTAGDGFQINIDTSGNVDVINREAGFMAFRTSDTERMRIDASGGVYTPNATGGSQGADTINASAVYDDGSLLTCYVLDAILDGDIDEAKWDEKVPNIPAKADEDGNEVSPEKVRTHEPMRKFKARLGGEEDPLDIDKYAAHWKTKRHLTSMPNEANYKNKDLSMGEWVQRLVETVEIQAVHIDQLNQRLKALENSVGR